MMTQ